MRDPPDFDTLESTELLQIFQDVIGKPIESVTEVKKLQLLSHTHHLQVWRDKSTIANNGYFIVTINTCYEKTSTILKRNIKKRQE